MLVPSIVKCPEEEAVTLAIHRPDGSAAGKKAITSAPKRRKKRPDSDLGRVQCRPVIMQQPNATINRLGSTY